MIARALAQDPRLLPLDEPTTFLDLHNQVRVLETIVRLVREQGLTVLMTIHDPNQALGYSDQAVLLRRLDALEGVQPGAVERAMASSSMIASGDPASVLSPEHILEAYGVGVDAIQHANRRLLVPTG